MVVSKKPPLETVAPLKKIIDAKEKELGSSGRILVRYSGTENKLRVMVECEDEEQCKRHVSEVVEVVERELGAV